MRLRQLHVDGRAKAELLDAFDYLEQQQKGLARRLAIKVRDATIKVRTTPLSFPVYHGQFRKYRVDPFKYALIYRLNADDSILIASFFHLQKNPERFQQYLDTL